MKRIKSFEAYSDAHKMAQAFLDSMSGMLNESDENIDYKEIQDDALDKLKSGVKSDIILNFGLVGTFGAGIGALYPVVEGLLTKSSIQVDARSVVLLTIAAVYMIVLEEMKHKADSAGSLQRKQIEKETQAVLEELKLAGFPNAKTGTKNGSDNTVLSKVVDALKCIKGIFSSIKGWLKDSDFSGTAKRTGATLFGGFADMLAYTGMLIPIMNGLNAIIGLYDMDFSAFISNAALLVSSIGVILAKHGVSYLISKIKGIMDLTDREKKELKSEIGEIDTPLIKKVGDTTGYSVSSEEDLIKGQ